ncbi:DNA-formamidopyrimidine glycosylase [Alkalilimnicola ehrlichii]|uniref:Formamidopyrimidine-DNA glycosylase n=1 Tax=Alkalilimnicola ehrlichii TaxID=351052 RepID=A0A3E0WX78_9GAMM|nr:bifunctional DNA-formamidopyrimidine glycosylase/DNA-(apurinic or apyrimidinic site) lyase [Alkalilimnicola ehrlichii]RFA30065.1 DNA-formamidopyrimidine glycosylase [Alkalilimnicola ehrlichii]RFA37408.1 DNA-formamidopyrimidine glycosylase [Alkalilimnicola ehrlichii]
MPELPEVETTLRGIAPYVEGHRVSQVMVRERRLRWPIPFELAVTLCGETVTRLRRRGKYLLFDTRAGTMLMHLGMSGSLRILREPEPPKRHEHVDIVFDDGACLRFTDPRRFGSMHWVDGDPQAHPLLAHLGPEPLSDEFTGTYLYRRSRNRRSPIKTFLMDSEVVVGVGNIYANEALFQAGIRPTRPAGKVGLVRYQRLAEAVKEVLAAAIQAGGTTLRDFTSGEGKPGYFKQELAVYGRAGEACLRCEGTVEVARLGQRATYYCPDCQR